jgi:Tfp pilus assembly protein PilW
MVPTGQHHPTPRRASRDASRRGLSIVEVMISLTITSFLLVAIAAAYNASADAVEMNDRFFRATQAGRVTMNQILTEIRRADWVACSPGSDIIYISRPAQTRLTDEDTREYRYDPPSKKLTLQIHYKNAANQTWVSPIYTLASNVETATFGPAEKITDATGNLQDARVPVTIDVKIGNNSVRLSGSSGPRRMLQN